MKLPRLTQELVFKACEEMHQAGKHPTLRELLQTIGFGSYTTLSKYRTEWLLQRRENKAPLALGALPATLSGPLQTMWAEANRVAEDAFNQQRDELLEAMAERDELHEKDQLQVQGVQAENARLLGLYEQLNVSHTRVAESLDGAQKAAAQSQQLMQDHLEMVTQLRDQIREGLSALNAQGQSTDSQVQILGKIIGGLGEKVEASVQKLREREDGTLNFMQSRLAELHSDQEKLLRGLKAHQEQVRESVQYSLSAFRTERDQSEQVIQKALAGLAQGVTSLTQMVGEQVAQSQELQGRFEAISTQIGTVSSGLGELRQQMQRADVEPKA